MLQQPAVLPNAVHTLLPLQHNDAAHKLLLNLPKQYEACSSMGLLPITSCSVCLAHCYHYCSICLAPPYHCCSICCQAAVNAVLPCRAP